MTTVTITMKERIKEIGFAVDHMVSWAEPPISLWIYMFQAGISGQCSLLGRVCFLLTSVVALTTLSAIG